MGEFLQNYKDGIFAEFIDSFSDFDGKILFNFKKKYFTDISVKLNVRKITGIDFYNTLHPECHNLWKVIIILFIIIFFFFS